MSLFQRKEPARDIKYLEQVMRYFSAARSECDKKYVPFIEAFAAEHENSPSKTIAAAAEWIPDPKTPDGLYLVSQAWVFGGAAHRPQAIKYLEQYVSSGALAYHLRRNNNQKGYEANVYIQLGDCYYGEAIYPKALVYYSKAVSVSGAYAYPFVKMAKTYLKTKDYEGAISELTAARNVVVESDKQIIDANLIKAQTEYIKDLKKQLGVKK